MTVFSYKYKQYFKRKKDFTTLDKSKNNDKFSGNYLKQTDS